MGQLSYVFEDAARARELERLQAIEELFDPETQRLLSSVGLWEGRRCLEVGAGAGSIAAWMKSKAGPSGRVLAIDLDVRFLERFAPEIEIVQGDVRDAALPAETFDVVHARYVLIHNADSAAILDALVRCLKPGGFMLLEEPDFGTIEPSAGPERLSQGFSRVGEAINAMFRARGMNPALGRSLGAMFQARGLDIASLGCDAHLARGGSVLAKMMGLSALQLTDKYIETGSATAEDVQTYGEFSTDPSCWGIYYSTFRALGRK
jgi:SAM-dependent methyltransferase